MEQGCNQIKCEYLWVVVQLVDLILPASLDNDSGTEDQSHEEDGVPQLLQVLLEPTRKNKNEEHLKHSSHICKQILCPVSHRDTRVPWTTLRLWIRPPLLWKWKQEMFVFVPPPHLDLRVGLSRADDPLPLSVHTSSRSATAGPQGERGSLPEHTASARHLFTHHWRVPRTEKHSQPGGWGSPSCPVGSSHMWFLPSPVDPCN